MEHHELTSRQKEMIRAAVRNLGMLHVPNTDIGGDFVAAGKLQFRDDRDPSVAPTYLDEFYNLVDRGVFRHSGGIAFRLTGLGCRLAKLLEAGPSDQLQRENVRDVDVVDVTPPHTKLLEVRGAPDPRESPPTVAVRGKPPEYLTSYREICKAVGRDASDVELIKRLNRQYGGPIQPGKKGKRPFVVKSEFLAWWETLAERMNASDSAGESQQKPTAGVKIGKDTIQTFPEESMHEKKRRSDFSGS